MSRCSFCAKPLAGRPSLACELCGTSLHHDCWQQIEERQILGCGHGTTITSAAQVAPDVVVSASHQEPLRVWDLGTGRDQELKGPPFASRVFSCTDAERFIVAGTNEVVVYDVASLERLTSIEVENGINYSAATPDGSRLALCSGQRLMSVDVATGKRRALGEELEEYPSALAISPDGSSVAVLLQQGRLQVRDAVLGETLSKGELREISEYFNRFAFDHSGMQVLLHCYGKLVAVDPLSGLVLSNGAVQMDTSVLRSTPDGTVLLVASSPHRAVQVRAYDPARPEAPLSEAESYEGHCSSISGAHFLDDQHFVTWGEDRMLMVVDRAETTVRRRLVGHHASFWRCRQQQARRLWTMQRRANQQEAFCVLDDVVVAQNETSHPMQIEERALSSGQFVRNCDLRGAQPQLIGSLEHDRRQLLVLVLSDRLKVLSRDDGQELCDAKGRSVARHLPVVLQGPDGPLLVTGGRWETNVEAFRLADGELAWRTDVDDANTPTFLFRTSAGQVLWIGASNDYSDTHFLPRRVGVDGELERLRPLRIDGSWSTTHAVPTPDGRHLVCGPVYLPNGRGHAMAVLEIDTAKLVCRTVVGHRLYLKSVAVSPVGTLLATGADDRAVRLWDVRTGELVEVFAEPSHLAPARLYFGPDGATLVTVDEEQLTTAWDLTGLDERTDLYSALCQARRGGEPARAAAARLAAVRVPSDREAIAAALLFRHARPSDEPPELVALLERVVAAASDLAELADDFDQRVADRYRQLTSA